MSLFLNHPIAFKPSNKFSISVPSSRLRSRVSSTAVRSDLDLASNYIPAAPILLPEGPWNQIPGGVTAAKGFKAAGIYGGLRAKGEKPDLSLVACDVDAVAGGLAKSVAWDGEGATCLIEVSVSGANNEAEAAKFARSVASSSLVKAAVYGRDPNWGRIACAVGYAGIQFNLNDLNISLGDIPLMNRGQPLQFDRAAASNHLKHAGETHGTVEIHISVGTGEGIGKAWGCDLSYDYVKINAEYTT